MKNQKIRDFSFMIMGIVLSILVWVIAIPVCIIIGICVLLSFIIKKLPIKKHSEKTVYR